MLILLMSIILVLSSVLLTPVMAHASIIQIVATVAPLAISQGEAESFIHSLSDQASQVLGHLNLPRAEHVRYFRNLFNTTADIEVIGRFVLGRYWRKATEAERSEFLLLFEDIAAYTWSQRLKEYAGHNLTITGVRSGVGNETIVESTVSQPRGSPLSVLWKLNRSNDKIRITDLVVEGISMVVTYRSEYSAVIQRCGGEVSGLLVALRNKMSELKNGH